jgi:hypothetical protein
LAAAGRKMTCSAGVAWRKGHRHKTQKKDDVAPRSLKGRTFRKRCWKCLERNSDIKNPGTRQQLHLKIERTSEEFDRKAFRLVFVR